MSESRYGVVVARTSAGARCEGTVSIPRPRFGEIPPSVLPERVAAADGVIRWTYPTPRTPALSGTHSLTCRGARGPAEASARFEIARRTISPTGFTVRVTTDAPRNATYSEDETLIALRESSAARMRAMLSAEWRTATRGLGTLEVVEESADIVVHVVAARSTSVHRTGADGSEDVIVYVSSPEIGPRSDENNVAVALHELGHIWCCSGPGTADGHWLTKERDPRLYGVDKYGLMTDPVSCARFGTITSCPNRFSDRELTAMGFTNLPAPVPDACVVRSLALRSEYDANAARRAELVTTVAATDARLTELDRQIRAIEAQYASGGAPSSVLATYRALISEYNGLLAARKGYAAEHDSLLARARALATEIGALPCDPS